MRIVTWNMAYWKPGRYNSIENRRRQWAFAFSLGADVLLLQECRPPDFEAFAPAWARNEYAIIGSIPERWTASSAVVARATYSPTAIPPDDHPWFEYLSGYVVRAHLDHPSFGGIRVASVHAIAKDVDDACLDEEGHARIKQPGCARAWHCDLAANGLFDWVGDQFVVGGDWNNARLFDTNYGDRWPRAARDFFASTKAHGWAESMRKFHDEEVQTYLDPASAPYQLDHLFTDAVLDHTLHRCEVINDALIRELSDHAPIVADFEDAASPA